MQNHKNLAVWKKAMELAEAIFKQTALFPREQLYVLTAQMQRSALSVASNIAEGRGRNSENEFAYFLNIARGSLTELQTQIQLAQRLGFLSSKEAVQLEKQSDEVLRMLHGLRDKLSRTKAVSSKLSAVG
jgi:four helix bundle protein